MSEVVQFVRPDHGRAMMLELANRVEAMSGLMRDMALLMDAREKTASEAVASLVGRVVAIEARLSRRERETAPRAFLAD